MFQVEGGAVKAARWYWSDHGYDYMLVRLNKVIDFPVIMALRRKGLCKVGCRIQAPAYPTCEAICDRTLYTGWITSPSKEQMDVLESAM
eukprot:747421-Hanusia_phi.AAC.5